MFSFPLLLFGALTQDPELPTIRVLAQRPDRLLDTPQAVTVLRSSQAEPGATHPNELFDAVPGTWVSRGSGQEHLTAIRSPVLTGAGACGAFLLLENGVPIRPPGVCNVNNLFELHTEADAAVEVVRGPASVLYGSNALHGAINLQHPVPEATSPASVTLWLGSDDYERVDASWSGGASNHAVRADLTGVSAGSFRDAEGYDQQKLSVNWRWSGRSVAVDTLLAASNLNQETAGFIFGNNAFADTELRRSNVNPEAFRDASSARLSSRVSFAAGPWDIQLTPFARYSSMTFLQHFLPGQPLEENGQHSFGLRGLARRELAAGTLTVGADVDWADTFLRQTQDGLTQGSQFLQETRPPGVHYRYDAKALTAAAFVQWTQRWRDWTVQAGLRGERSRYRYDNLALDGNTRDDGSACGFGGCLYNRPADRRDSFTDVAPRLSVQRALSDGQQLYLRVGRGFRAPQVTELYRLQRQQSVADLDSEKLTTAEAGYRHSSSWGYLALGAYYMSKRNFIFRDSAGFNVSDGRTRHLGLELETALRLGERWRLDGALTLARHRYGFSRNAGGGEVISAGNEIDTAPSWQAQVSLSGEVAGAQARLQWVGLDGYFLDAANSQRYGGHHLLHLNLQRELEGFSRRWQVQVRLQNLANRRYAERADFAFGNLRYFPGAGRTVLLGLTTSF
ncbi:MAG: TonB-dependent receptor [Pseudomonadota bacterium]